MCGIAGWIGVGHPEAVLDGVRAAGHMLHHRGPDDEALLVLAANDGLGYLETASQRTDVPAADDDLEFSVVIAHRRLAILDLGPAGAQPMPSADQRIWLAYNGEIYNHVELRQELEREGYGFRGRSDTEVLLAAYERWGLGCLERLAGMFAFVIVDRERRTVVFARDHLGQKPLFLRPVVGGLAFASEIPAVLRIHPTAVRAALHPTVDYLATGRTDHRADTMIEGVRRLDPGTVIEIDDPTSLEWDVRRYWSVPPVRRPQSTAEPDEAASRLRHLFDRSVSWHLRSDVPIGSLLSGGLDSSALVLAQRQIGGADLELRAVSYIGTGEAKSEEPWIDLVSAAAGCRTSKLRLDADLWSGAVAAAKRQGEPMGSPAILVHHALCQHARDTGVKVLLDGQGADELLAGYPAAVPLRVAGLLRRGDFVTAGRLVAALVRGSKRRGRQAAGTLFKTARVLARQRRPLRRWPWLTVESDMVRNAAADLDRPLSLSALVRRYLAASLPAILRWEDRNTMAASIEGRLPFLLPELVEFCLALPEEHLVGPHGEGKYVFRRAVHDLLPAAVSDRRAKIGLSVPLHTWACAVSDVARRFERVAAIPGISPAWVRQRLDAIRSGAPLSQRDLFIVWRLVGFDLWREALGVTVAL
jgi:asparagine synthase (glutamine-hydrolysing)